MSTAAQADQPLRLGPPTRWPTGAARRPVFQILAAAAGVLVLVILALDRDLDQPAGLLVVQHGGWRSSRSTGTRRPTVRRDELVYGTVITAAIAIILSVPVSVAMALLLTEVRCRSSGPADRVRGRPAGRGAFVVWGLWGILVFAPGSFTSTPRSPRAVKGSVLDPLFGQPVSGASSSPAASSCLMITRS